MPHEEHLPSVSAKEQGMDEHVKHSELEQGHPNDDHQPGR